jgi:hypothetical protein
MLRSKRAEFWTSGVRYSIAATLFFALISAGGVARAACTGCTFFGTGAGIGATGEYDSAFGLNALYSGDSGGVNTATGAFTLLYNTKGVYNTAVGIFALEENTMGSYNTASGADALNSNTTGEYNTAIGLSALNNNTTGENNTAAGAYALFSNTTVFRSRRLKFAGGNNTAAGAYALYSNTTGSNNIAIGWKAGENLTTESNNIDIGNAGVAGDSAIRVGTEGTQTATYIAGIYGTTISSPQYVVVDSSGQLGSTATPPSSTPSSARYKRDIRDLGDASNGLLRLRPVSFRYKLDPTRRLQYGLIAEEVERVYPELVTYGDGGKVEGVRYYLLPALLLNEVQKQAKQIRTITVEAAGKDVRIAALQKQVASQDEQIASQQEQLEALKKKEGQIDALAERMNALERAARVSKAERLAAATR